MTLAAMPQEARPTRLPGASHSNGPANNDSAFPVLRRVRAPASLAPISINSTKW
jgi:hypothetical protein